MNEKKYELDQVAIRMVREKPLYSTEPIDSPEKAVKLLADAIRDYDREVVCVINLNSALQPINLNICSMGAIDRAIVSPREVLKSSILSNASSVMLFHNHPSGMCNPSEQDVQITDRMQEVYKLMAIKLLDHIIIGDDNYYSFAENKIMPESQLSFTSIMELYQMKHGIEAQMAEVIEQQKKLEEVKGQGIAAESAQIYDVLEESEGAEPKSALEIAERLNEWYQDFDVYNYNDSVDDAAANVQELKEQIEAAQTEDIIEYIQEAIDEGDPDDKIIIRAKELLKDMEEYKPLAKVEEIEEQNYNMIDNRINNVEPKEEKQPTKKDKKAKEQINDKRFEGAKFGNFKIQKKVENIRFALIADVKMPDGEVKKDQKLGEFKDKAAVEEYCKQKGIAYDDITNYLQNMIEHKKQKVYEKLEEAQDISSPKIGRKGRARE